MDGTQNEYLALREAKIKRNNERLEKLGLSSSGISGNGSSNGNNKNYHDESNQLDRQRQNQHQHQHMHRAAVVLRRSSRRRSNKDLKGDDNNGTTTSLSSNSNANDQSIISGNHIKKRKRAQPGSSTENDKAAKNSNNDESLDKSMTNNTVAVAPVAKPGTTRATQIDVQKVLCGQFNYPVFIGRQLSSPGKAPVVEHANLQSMNDIIVGMSFNKYSGVCEWSNDTMFLWVNINSPDADVQNEFYGLNSSACSVDVDGSDTGHSNDNDDGDNNSQSRIQNKSSSCIEGTNENNGSDEKITGGMLMTWYGGSRMKAESYVIQRLISVGKKAARGELKPSSGIVLWCRVYNVKKKGFDPYICLGRLSYHSHDENVHPIKFEWNLVDYDILMEEGSTDNQFQGIIEASQNVI